MFPLKNLFIVPNRPAEEEEDSDLDEGDAAAADPHQDEKSSSDYLDPEADYEAVANLRRRLMDSSSSSSNSRTAAIVAVSE